MISKIHLLNFRNFDEKVFSFSPKISVVVGENAVGKTNLLESINLLSTGKSFKAKLEEEMIRFSSKIGRVKASVVNKGGEKSILEAVLTRGEIESGNSFQRVPKKRLLVNDVPRRLIDFSGNLKTVLFGPWDLDLVTESPSLRRRLLDTILSTVDREYRRSTISYEKSLRQRNRLLLAIRENGASRQQLYFWDRILIKNGGYITAMREGLIDFINSTSGLDSNLFRLDYDKSIISEARLFDYKTEEVAAATTLVGPHRDDFIFMFKNKVGDKIFRDLSKYGSRGEQRMGVLWIKIAELEFIEQRSGEKPTLLLDDIFSELDHPHREVVINKSNDQQTIITTADPHFVEAFKGIELIKLKNLK